MSPSHSPREPKIAEYAARLSDLSLQLQAIISLTGDILALSESWEDLLGVAPKTLISQSWFDLVDPEDLERARADHALLSLSEGSQGSVHSQVRLRSRNGARFSVDFRACYESSIPGILFSGHRLETGPSPQGTGLQDTHETLARLAALGELSSAITHEVANPLMVIVGKTAVLEAMAKTGQLAPEKVADCARKIKSMSDRILATIRSVRALSRNGDDDPFTLTSVRELVADAVELADNRFRKSNVDLIWNEVAPDALLECRGIQISQAILNLLNNAYDAVATQDKGWVEVKGIDEDECVRIMVTDSGTGIRDEVAVQLFKPFFTTKGPGKGTGLGLSLAAKIALQHGGELLLDKACSNTRFILRLPKTRKRGGK